MRDKNGLRTEVGALERAHGGTLYLSEVASLPLEAQTSLLRALVENKFTRVDGHGPVPVDVRIVSSSSQNVAGLIEEGKFRTDLFHRLSVVPLQLTSLRERREDIPSLVSLFVAQLSRMHNLPRFLFGDDAIAVLQGQDWPGNARQLRNAIERLLILVRDQKPADGVITAAMLPSDISEVLPTIGDPDEPALAGCARSFRAPVPDRPDRAVRGQHLENSGICGHGAKRIAPQDQIARALVTGDGVLTHAPLLPSGTLK